MKYLIRNGKVEFSGNRQQLINYIKEKYPKEYWVREYGKEFDKDYGKFKFAVETLGLTISDKMTNREYSKTHRR